TKAGAAVGDMLILTKPLGTAVILAATRAGACPSDWTEAAIESMRRPNAAASVVLAAARVKSCTDVSGFGLIGHLREMLSASHVAARLDLRSLPALPGALELLAKGWRSSADPATRGLLEGVTLPGPNAESEARVALLCDPQTSGGLLAAVPADALAD